MFNYFDAGDIMLHKFVSFKDGGGFDTRRNARPYMHLIDYEAGNDTGYLVKLQSSPKQYNENKELFFPIYPNSHNNLRKPSYADLRFVYKIAARDGKIIGRESASVIAEILQKMETCQGTYCNRDSDYNELNGHLHK